MYQQVYIDRGNGPVVILLHGLFGNISVWMPVVDELQKTHRVIIPRLPLFDLPLAQTNVSFLVRVLHEFIEWHQLSYVTLVGHAVGGQVALFYAHQHPEAVEKIVLVGSSGLMDQNPADDSGSSLPTNYNFISEKVRTAFYQEVPEVEKLTRDIYDTVQSLPKRMVLTSLVQSSLHSKVASFLGKLELPVLLIWGLQDKISPPEVALHFHDLLKNAEMKFIDKCGHVPMIEQTAEFNRALTQFLKHHEKF
jgi:2-hydroxy-6-oxonona-2,4-dienedioate hydrolase